MHLKQLTISGFKSFAKKSDLEFRTAVTAIVGPNGSGKSNVAESFRFVLGEQSHSRMRGKKGEDLIWGGTDKVARGNRASVTLTLNNERRVFPLDFDEIILERVVHRDGENEYIVNGSRVRLKDVQELLAAANIGPSGHHIISQGEADRILLANPRERREMIEDALGLKVYQYKKQEAEKKLAKTRENIAHVESLRREVAPHLKFLERQIKKIARATSLREELIGVYAEYLRREDVYLAHRYDTLMSARKDPADRLEKLASELANAKDVLAKAEKDQKREQLVAAESALAQVRKDHQAQLHTVGQLEGQISLLDRQIKTARERESERSDATVPYDKVARIVADIEQTATRLQSEENISVLRRAFADVVHTLKAFLTRAETGADKSDSHLETERAALTQQKQELDSELRALASREDVLQREYDAVRSEIESEVSEGREAEREMFRIVGEQREAESTVARIDRELEEIMRDREEFKRELQEAVALIGRHATDYTSHQIIESDRIITDDDIIGEPRDVQRNRRRELEKMKIRLEELGGANDDIEKEYTEVKERDEFLVREISDLIASVEKLEQLISELNQQLDSIFDSGIEKIGVEFNRFFALMFGGGEAKLLRVKPRVKKSKTDVFDGEETLLVDAEESKVNEVGEGIEIDVKLPNKRVRGLDMLSGGERALTSIALIFAMSQVNPPLFVILDETDAALDEANSRRYGDMIEALSEKSQLILITHNRETMRRAGVLYGVTMSGDGVSKLLSVRFEEAAQVAK